MGNSRNLANLLNNSGDMTVDTNTLHVDATNNAVGINNTTPNSFFAGATNLVVGSGSGDEGMTIYSGTSSIGNIKFADGTGSDAAKTAGGIRYDHSGSYLRFDTNDGSEAVRIDSSGHVGIGDSTPVSVLEVRKNSVSNGRLATFGSNGTASTDVVSGLANAITIGRSYINVPANTATNLVSGYGGSLVLLTILQDTGVADVQRTVLVTHAWNAALVLFSNNYGANSPTITFSALSSNLRVSHNHSGALNFNVQALIVPGPASGG